MDTQNKPLFMHMRNLRLIRKPPRTIIAERLSLENVAAYNVEVDVGDLKTTSIISLREVPSFLIEAFSRIGQLDGYRVEGIFRREGAAARIKEGSVHVFFGVDPIPSTFLIHDVCSWIKRFFRDLKTPLFKNSEPQLLKYAETFWSAESKAELFAVSLNLIERLPSAHLGTLGYLMRCLQEISEQANIHQMTVENLAMVFAPSIFRNQPCIDQKQNKKVKSNSSDNLLNIEQMKRTNELQALVIQVLIENAEKIGVPKDCYKASRRPSDLKKKQRKLIESSLEKNENLPPIPPHGKRSPRNVKKNTSLKGSQSTSDLSKVVLGSTPSLVQTTPKIEDGKARVRKNKRLRSNSVVRAFGALKSYFKEPNSQNEYSQSPQSQEKEVPRARLEDFGTPISYRQQHTSSPSPRLDFYSSATPSMKLRISPDISMTSTDLSTPPESPGSVSQVINYSPNVTTASMSSESERNSSDMEPEGALTLVVRKLSCREQSMSLPSEVTTPMKRNVPCVERESVSPAVKRNPSFTQPVDLTASASSVARTESIFIETNHPRNEAMRPIIRRNPTFDDAESSLISPAITMSPASLESRNPLTRYNPRTRHLKTAEKMLTSHFDDDFGRASIMNIQRSGVVRQRIQQFDGLGDAFR